MKTQERYVRHNSLHSESICISFKKQEKNGTKCQCLLIAKIDKKRPLFFVMCCDMTLLKKNQKPPH